MDIIKYPRTRHLEGSRLQTGDEDLDCVPFAEIAGHFLVLEEKMDGANCGISFDGDGRLLLQSRGHFLTGGYGERQFDLFKAWARCFQAPLYELLGGRYILYGEWLFAKHTVFYDALPHYFMEFDIFDKQSGIFLSTTRRRELLAGYPFIVSVLVLHEGALRRLEELSAHLGPSHFKTSLWQSAMEHQCLQAGIPFATACKQSDGTDLMEGVYIKVETADAVTQRLKYVRGSFLTAIRDSETHWQSRPILPNLLGEGADLFAAGRGAAP